MRNSRHGLPLTISLKIPTYWTQEQAFAVYQLIDDLRDAIWQHYQLQLEDEYRNQCKPTVDYTERQSHDPDDPSF